jgi:mono/diheme cytochrome c family protein
MRLRNYVLLSLLLFVVLGGTGIAQDSQTLPKRNSDYTELSKAPEKSRAKQNPLAKDPEAATAGRILFAEKCAGCHGADAEGGKKGPSLRVGEVQDATDGAIFWVLTNGVVRRGMPVWSKLPEPQRWQLVSYVKSLGIAPADSTSAAKP